VLAPPYSRGRDFDRLGEGVDHGSLQSEAQARGRPNTSLVCVTLYRTRTGGKRRSARSRALRGEAVADATWSRGQSESRSPRALNVTALTSVGFATVLGALAGLMPAVNAARMDPVAALRYE
jgi:hypothetical protein